MKVGIIGLGHGAKVLLHAFNQSNIEIHGIVGKNFNKAKKIANLNKINNVYDSWQNLVKDKNIDIVAIAVPAVHQIPIINECIKKNKYILAEKPVGIDFSKTEKIFTKLKKYKKIFLMDYIFPEHNAFKKFKEIITKQKTYKDDSVSICFNLKKIFKQNKKMKWKSQPHLGGGLINLYLSHIIDYVVIFFGNISKVECDIQKNRNFEKLLRCQFTFKTGLKVRVIINKNSASNKHSIKYYSKNFNLDLTNTSDDYCKGFIIKFTKKNSIRNKNTKEIKYKDNLKVFDGDSRILLTSRIIDKFKLKVRKSFLNNHIRRYHYNEFVLNKSRISSKKRIVQTL